MKVFLLAVFIAVAAAQRNAYYPEAAYKTPEYAPQPYSFEWGVKDAESYNDYSHSEKSDGKVTSGSYRVLLPDGRTQIVTYRDDSYGYVADVRYEGEAKYPEYKPAPAYRAPAPSYPAPPAYKAPEAPAPVYAAPVYKAPEATPVYRAPVYSPPSYKEPSKPVIYESSPPVYEAPAVYRTTTEAPASYSAPVYTVPAPAYKAPESPVYKAPVYIVPSYKPTTTTVAPVYEAPTTPVAYRSAPSPVPLLYRANTPKQSAANY